MTTRKITRSIWINAPREQVWQAINEPDQLAQWFMPPMLQAQMKRDAAGRAYVLMGLMEVPLLTFADAEPPGRVTLRGFPDHLISVTYTLEAENGGTQVTVTMSGFNSLAEEAYQERVGPSSAGWEKALENLKAHNEGAELPHPQGYVASLLGYRREGQEKYSVERTIWLNAPPERVWQAITDPQEIQQWYSPNQPWQLTALEVGETYTAYNAETGAYEYPQIIEVVDPPRQLVLRALPTPENVQDVTSYTLIPENGGTRFILTNTGYELDPVTRHMSMEQNAFGFGMALENLQAYLQGEALPYPFGF